jgi:putative endonuclease
MDKYYTYILFSGKLNKFYVGSTNDLQLRFQEHNRGKTPFSKLGMPWQLKYYQEFNSRSQAVQREMEIKRKKDRKYIQRLIDSFDSEHPG